MNQRVYALSRVDKMYQHNKKHHQSDTSAVSLRREKKDGGIQTVLWFLQSKAELCWQDKESLAANTPQNWRSFMTMLKENYILS